MTVYIFIFQVRGGYRSCSYCLHLHPISIDEVKIAGGATSLKLEVPPQTTISEGLWSFLDKYHPHYSDSSSPPGSFRPLLPSDVLEILNKIPEDTKLKLLSKEYQVQEGYVLDTLAVPPNCLHVPIDMSADGKAWMCSVRLLHWLIYFFLKIMLNLQSCRMVCPFPC